MGNTQTFRMARLVFYRLAAWQLAATVVVVVAATAVSGSIAAVSAACGGLIGIVAGLYQALRMLRVDASKYPEQFMASVYLGEALKIVLTVALLIAAIRLLGVEMVPTMSGYAATYVVYWAALKTDILNLQDRTTGADDIS